MIRPEPGSQPARSAKSAEILAFGGGSKFRKYIHALLLLLKEAAKNLCEKKVYKNKRFLIKSCEITHQFNPHGVRSAGGLTVAKLEMHDGRGIELMSVDHDD